jgi:purine-binding chemotaxis protein CheW
VSTVPTPRTAEVAPAADAVVVRLGASRFAVALASVAEVGRVPVTTRVPGVPGWLAGIANWRGRILPVLDLRSVLGEPAGPVSGAARLVVVTADGANVGVLVDAVEATTTLSGDIAAFPLPLDGLAAGLVTGQIPADDGPVAVLDVGAVVALRDALPQVRRTA